MVKLAIIEADTPAPAVEAKHGKYGDIFTKLLRNAGLDEETAISIHHVVEHPENLPVLEGPDKPDAVLITGSKHNSYEDIPWINQLAAFSASAVASGVKVVGKLIPAPPRPASSLVL